MKNNVTEKIRKIKRAIDESKTKRAELEGRRKQLMERLKNDFGCESLEDANRRIETLSAEVEEMQAKLDDSMAKLDEMMGMFENGKNGKDE